MSYQFSSLIEGKVDYIDGIYIIKLNESEIPVDERCLTLNFPCKIYSLPTNDKRGMNVESKLTDLPHNISKVLKYWGKYAIGSIVEGSIIKGKFLIKQIKKLPKDIRLF